eukprot:1161490-Pelagomonas_calceolata.AAC.7
MVILVHNQLHKFDHGLDCLGLLCHASLLYVLRVTTSRALEELPRFDGSEPPPEAVKQLRKNVQMLRGEIMLNGKRPREQGCWRTVCTRENIYFGGCRKLQEKKGSL